MLNTPYVLNNLLGHLSVLNVFFAIEVASNIFEVSLKFITIRIILQVFTIQFLSWHVAELIRRCL
jgi:hypothetical protein